MPRIENIGKNVDEWAKTSRNGSSTFDVCLSCAVTLKKNPHAFDNKLQPYNGDPDGDLGRSWEDCGTPDLYGTLNAEEPGSYRCDVCHEPLKNRDNDSPR